MIYINFVDLWKSNLVLGNGYFSSSTISNKINVILWILGTSNLWDNSSPYWQRLQIWKAHLDVPMLMLKYCQPKWHWNHHGDHHRDWYVLLQFLKWQHIDQYLRRQICTEIFKTWFLRNSWKFYYDNQCCNKLIFIEWLLLKCGKNHTLDKTRSKPFASCESKASNTDFINFAAAVDRLPVMTFHWYLVLSMYTFMYNSELLQSGTYKTENDFN